MLRALVRGRMLVVNGAAAQSNGSQFEVDLTVFGPPSVKDNNSVRTDITIRGDTSAIRNIDLHTVTRAGAAVYAYGDATAHNVIATQQSDYVYVGGGDDRVSGLNGNDRLFGNDGDDELNGGKGDDTLNGGNDDDTITGGAGNDTIDGGDGIDTAIYSGNRSDYDLKVVDGSFRLIDLRGRSPDGTDTIGSVEFLQFANQTVALRPNPTNLDAVVNGRTLVVSGAAAQSNGIQIKVDLTASGPPSVTDNNSVRTEVAIRGNTSALRNIDLHEVTGAGATVYAYGDAAAHNVIATQQSDYVYVGSANDRVSGLNGDDRLFGNDGDDDLNGGRGNDTIDGGNDDDAITAGAGNDTIDGGDGIDTAIYSGNRSDYDLKVVDGSFQLFDLRGRSPDGTDTIGNVEYLQFADQTVALRANPTNLDAVVNGRTLVVSGAAGQSDGSQIEVDLTAFGPPVVKDNNSVGTDVAIRGDTSAIRNIDLHDVTGAGAAVYAYGTASAHNVIATQQSDYVYVGAGDDRVFGLNGNDRLFGNDGDDELNGGKGDDTLNGGNNDDTVIGGAGNDTIDGGDGIDTAIYSGNRSDYNLQTVDGSFQLIDIRGQSPDGVDTIGNVEFLQFADQRVATASFGREITDSMHTWSSLSVHPVDIVLV